MGHVVHVHARTCTSTRARAGAHTHTHTHTLSHTHTHPHPHPNTPLPQAALRVTLDVIGLAGFGHDYQSVKQDVPAYDHMLVRG